MSQARIFPYPKIVDLERTSHQVYLVEQWGIRFFMLEAAKLWLPVIKDGSWEQSQREYFISRSQAFGARIGIDIGANNGIYTLLMCQTLDLKKIYAFEPCEPHYSLMRESIRLNGFDDRCMLDRLALSDEQGNKPMYVFPDETPSLNQFAETQIKTQSDIERLGARLEHVKTHRLDDLLDLSNERIAIKIDTEGHELKVVRGARRLLTENHCLLQIESFDDGTIGSLESLGYSLIYHIRNDWYFHNDSSGWLRSVDD